VNKIHSGKVLLATVVGTAYRVVGISLLVEDTLGSRLKLQLYNYMNDDTSPMDVFPQGTHLAILEPYLKFPRDNPTQVPNMRCDNPQAIRIIHNRDEWERALIGDFRRIETSGVIIPSSQPSDVSTLCESGNLEFSRGCYTKAIDFYTKALMLDDTCARALSNRSQCYMCLEKYGLLHWKTQMQLFKLMKIIGSASGVA
jgi:hypothetical protein